jgi:hypothetical protein
VSPMANDRSGFTHKLGTLEAFSSASDLPVFTGATVDLQPTNTIFYQLIVFLPSILVMAPERYRSRGERSASNEAIIT